MGARKNPFLYLLIAACDLKLQQLALLQFQHAKGQLVNLLRISVEPSVSQEIRQSAAIAFKNLVKGSWSPSGIALNHMC